MGAVQAALPGPATDGWWRSLEELAGADEFRQFLESEFPNLPPMFREGPSRRQMLKLMGASAALAGLAGCRWPREHIVPATVQPYDRAPGETVQFATALERNGVATGVLATSYNGRPIKIEGNDQHPFSRGRSNHWQQAAVLSLYDPDRSTGPVRRPKDLNPRRRWEEFEAFARQHFGELRETQGTGLAVLSTASDSPSLRDMQARFARVFPKVMWCEYEAVGRENEIEGTRQAFGTPMRPLIDLDHAEVIVCLDCDLLVQHPAGLRYASEFAQGRRAEHGRMNRLWAFESNLSVTGSVADHRHAVRSGDIAPLLAALGHELGAGAAPAHPAHVPAEVVKRLAEDLAAHRGHGALAAGPAQPPEVHALVAWLNERLGNAGHTVQYVAEPARGVSIEKLIERVDEIETLVVLDGNPVYELQSAKGFVTAYEKIPTTIHLSLYDNETSRVSKWHVPQAHPLETWGDGRAWDGTITLVQPLIAPLYEGRTACELLALVSGDDVRSAYEITRRAFREYAPGPITDFDAAWKAALHAGLIENTAWPTLKPQVKGRPTVPPHEHADGYELVFSADHSVYDGRYANNGWLQEWPDPITKLTWDNAALLSPTDAQRLGLARNGDVVRIESYGMALELPAYILPGQAAGSITLPLGYGRDAAAGMVAEGAGFDVYGLRRLESPWIVGGAKVSRVDKHYPLVGTQDHHAIASEVGNEATQDRIPRFIREATLNEYKHHPEFAQHVVHVPPLESPWEERQYGGHQWGMVIDLSACIGCGACVLACQAENNIPVVGKEEVAMGREMHWIRVDRYFRAAGQGDGHAGGDGVRVAHQPVTCVQCEMAPCEQVCPVAATVHDTEGLNNMVYNRCIGTRYCSNNCPFKVRRFNWFYNHHGPYHPRSLKAGEVATRDGVNMLPGEYKKAPLDAVEKMVFNPDVTVRSRGVMEKCTFCVQRINRVKIQARNERWETIPDGLITPACAQACPSGAIVFGDLNDPESRVAKLHRHNRAYALLAELNIKPRTKYLARLRNPYGDAGGTHEAEHHH